MDRRNILLLLAAVLAVVIIGVTMAASGASSDTFMAMVLLGTGAAVLWMSVRYYKNPAYVWAGQEQKVGLGQVIFLFVTGVFLLLGGLYTAIIGFPQAP